jgi:hypothetical protein
LPVDLFVVQAVACAASFYAHVFFDKEYHVEGSRLRLPDADLASLECWRSRRSGRIASLS